MLVDRLAAVVFCFFVTYILHFCNFFFICLFNPSLCLWLNKNDCQQLWKLWNMIHSPKQVWCYKTSSLYKQILISHGSLKSICFGCWLSMNVYISPELNKCWKKVHMKHPAFSQHLYLNKFYGETIKDKNLLSKMFAPYIFPPKHFCFPVFFSSPEWHFTRKKFSKNFAGKISSPKDSAPPRHAPQNFLPRKFLSKKICSPFCFPNFHPKEFAPPIFPPKNLQPNIFALHISSYNEILLTKIPPKYFCWRNFLLKRISPPKLGPQNFLPRKFALKRNCSPFSILPPPKKKSFKRICSPNISSQKFAAKHFCSPYYFSQKLASQSLLPKNLCCPNHFVEQLWHLINTGAVAGYGAVPAALLLNFCHLLKIVILLRVGEQKKPSRPSICSRYPFTTAS